MGIILTVLSDGELKANGRHYRCAIGRAGVTDEDSKREGDKKTPKGVYTLRECWYRADKGIRPDTGLPIREITLQDGWCDDPSHPEYNTHVRLPFDASHEVLWREDDAYDLIIPISYNDDPVVPGKGSAIFLHVAQPDYRGTEGCVVLSRDDWEELLPLLDTESKIEIPVNL